MTGPEAFDPRPDGPSRSDHAQAEALRERLRAGRLQAPKGDVLGEGTPRVGANCLHAVAQQPLLLRANLGARRDLIERDLTCDVLEADTLVG